MSYQTEEQQIEQLKEWWKENGTALIVGAVLGLSGFFGWKYWTEKQIAHQEAASSIYLTVTDELESKDLAKLVENAKILKTQYSDTSYAVLAAFHLAKVAVDANNLNDAAVELKWVSESQANSELAQIAKLRLARILIAQDKAEEAIALLTFDADSGYFEIASFIKGEAFSSLGKKAEALEAYNAANNVGKLTNGHPTLKIKIDELTTNETVVLDSDDAIETPNAVEDTSQQTSEETSTEGASK